MRAKAEGARQVDASRRGGKRERDRMRKTASLSICPSFSFYDFVTYVFIILFISSSVRIKKIFFLFMNSFLFFRYYHPAESLLISFCVVHVYLLYCTDTRFFKV